MSGSLRAASIHTALLNAAAHTAPAGVEMMVFGGLDDPPHFNPDIEGQETESVASFRAALNAADAVLIACPEDAHGLPGAFKNALDWVVGSGELSGKRVLNAVLIGGPHGAANVLDVSGASKTIQGMWRSLLQTATEAGTPS